METQLKTSVSYIPANFLRAPGLLRLGAKAFRMAVANDDFDDDPPPSASAPIPIVPQRETEDDAEGEVGALQRRVDAADAAEREDKLQRDDGAGSRD